MNAVSLKTKLILLAFFPVFILASVLISKAYFSARHEAQSRVKHLRDSLYAERKQQTDTLLEMAGTAIASAADENSKKATLRGLRYDNGKNFLDSRSAKGRYLT